MKRNTMVLDRRQTRTKHDSGGDTSNPSVCCFPAGTQVMLADGSSKAIEIVRVGDQVMAFDGTKPVAVRVEALKSPVRDHMHTLHFDDGSTLKLTREHPVGTSAGWRSLSPRSTAEENAILIVGKLEVGDRVVTANGETLILTRIEYAFGQVQTYNLSELSGCNNYYADSFLVHNKAS